MRGKIFLVLLITILTGIQPVFAQPGYDVSTETAAEKKTVQKGEETININLASDDELTQSLEKADDVELINVEAVKPDEKANASNQEKPK